MSTKTITRWCETGKIAAIAMDYGKKITYEVLAAEVERLAIERRKQSEKQRAGELEQQLTQQGEQVHQHLSRLYNVSADNQQASPKTKVPHSELVPIWVEAMESGTVPHSSACTLKTSAEYQRYINSFLSTYTEVSIETFKKAISQIPKSQYASRKMLYRALTSFSKVLIEQKALPSDFLEQLSAYKPKDNPSPKREATTIEQFQALLDACESAQDTFIVVLLFKLGLRASEACNLRRDDILWKEGYLTVRHGKGDKTRRLTMPPIVKEALLAHYKALPKSQRDDFLLWNSHGKPMNRHGIDKRLTRLCQNAGIPKRGAHTLRRGFGTHNAERGKELFYIQKAYGHTSIKTTETYLQMSEQALLDEMKSWD